MGEEADEFKTPNKSSNVAKKLREFCTETTAHGLGRIASSTSRLERIIWSTCLLTAVVSMTYQGISLVSEYLTFPVDVKVELRYTNSQPFPAVVVCNMNSIKKSALKNVMDDNGTVAILDMIENLHLNGTRRKVINTYKHALLATMNRTIQKSIGHQVEDLILDCEWNGEACGPQNFTYFYNYVFGNCYVFNERKVKTNVTAPGSENGLSLVLNIEADDYYEDFSESYGAVVDVTSTMEMHFPEENGYLIAPGQATNIGFTKRIVSRLDKPYEGTSCSKGGDIIYVNRSYSEMACKKSCVANNQLRDCGCSGVAYPVTPNCDPFDSVQVRCAKEVSREIRLGNIPCNCPQDCRLFEYPATVSSAIWPTEGYLKSHLLERLGNRALNTVSDITQARRNLARVDVYYKSMTTEIIQQVPRYEVNEDCIRKFYKVQKFKDLISNIGGSLGLFAGVSLLTLLEICKLLFDLAGSFCKKFEEKVNSVDPDMKKKKEMT